MSAPRLPVYGSMRRFHTSGSGATAIEFALVAPIVLVMILALMSIGYTLFMGQALDYATQKAARQIRIGNVQTSRYSQSDYRTKVVCPLLPSMFSCDDVIVNIQAVSTKDLKFPNEYYDFVNQKQSGLIIPPLSNSSTSYCPGQQQGYVYVQVLYPLPIMVAALTPASGVTTQYKGSSVYVLMSTATILNEPFVAPASSC